MLSDKELDDMAKLIADYETIIKNSPKNSIMSIKAKQEINKLTSLLTDFEDFFKLDEKILEILDK